MESKKKLTLISQCLKRIKRNPRLFMDIMKTIPAMYSASEYTKTYKDQSVAQNSNKEEGIENPLFEYFENNTEGNGIWKWEHYFDVYHRYFQRFIGKPVNILEIGIYSGGSLNMWRTYFGDESHVYGVDIEQSCMSYQSDSVTVLIGDQEDREFWRDCKKKLGNINIIIDDGGHTPEQQQATLEEMLPYLSPGGVYLCEDIHGCSNRFSAYAVSLVRELNQMNIISNSPVQSKVSEFQSLYSIHFYPFLLVIEKHHTPLNVLSAPKYGTKWQPFFDATHPS